MGKEKLQELRALLTPFHQKEIYVFKRYQLHVPKDSLIQVYGQGKTEMTLQFLQEHPEWSVAWIEKSFSFYPPLLLKKGLSFEKTLFIESFAKNKDQTSQVLLQVLKSQLFKVVVVYHDHFDFKQLRRFQIFAEKSEVIVLWLTSQKKKEWPISSYWEASTSQGELHESPLP